MVVTQLLIEDLHSLAREQSDITGMVMSRLLWAHLTDRPALECAELLAALRNAGFPYTPQYRKDLIDLTFPLGEGHVKLVVPTAYEPAEYHLITQLYISLAKDTPS